MAKKILLVEDDEDIAALLRLNLLDEGYQIVHVADGAQALRLLEKELWDAVILDDAAGRRRSGNLSAHSSANPLSAGDYYQCSRQRNPAGTGAGDGSG